MSGIDDELNAYELLDIKLEATEQEIKSAYRQRSLKVHPDRNPNNPDAARKFHELNQAYELLLDPLRRLALDAKMRVKRAREERFKSYDNKRKNLVEELEERERVFKKARAEKQKEEVERWQATEKIKDEGRRMREEKEQEMRRLEQETLRAKERQDEERLPPALSPLDTTVRLKFTLKRHPTLVTPTSIATLLAQFGETDVESIVLSLKPSKGKKGDVEQDSKATKLPKSGTALVPFKQIGNAFAAVCASGRADRGLDGIEIGWVGGKEPLILDWLKKMGKLGAPNPPTPPVPEKREGEEGELPQHKANKSSSSSFASFPESLPETPLSYPREPPPINRGGIDYESLTLMRLRQAERERLEREIREQEANE